MGMYLNIYKNSMPLASYHYDELISQYLGRYAEYYRSELNEEVINKTLDDMNKALEKRKQEEEEFEKSVRIRQKDDKWEIFKTYKKIKGDIAALKRGIIELEFYDFLISDTPYKNVENVWEFQWEITYFSTNQKIDF